MIFASSLPPPVEISIRRGTTRAPDRCRFVQCKQKEQADDRQKPGAIVDQPLHGQGQAEHQQQERHKRSNRDRDPLGIGPADERLGQQDKPCDRQVDQP
jgi:hypothetical protein